jgi:hypothetical protein
MFAAFGAVSARGKSPEGSPSVRSAERGLARQPCSENDAVAASGFVRYHTNTRL